MILVTYEAAAGTSIIAVSFQLDGWNATSGGTFNQSVFSWRPPFDFSERTHTANFALFDNESGAASVEWTFTIDATAPSLVVAAPGETLTNRPVAAVEGSTDAGAMIKVNGALVPADPFGTFQTNVSLAEGLNVIVVLASDAAGNSVMRTLTMIRDSQPPILFVASPAVGGVSKSSVVHVSGVTEIEAQVWVNGLRVAVDVAGAWSVDLAFSDGQHAITTTAVDAARNAITDTRSVTVDTVAPAITLISPTAPLTNSGSVVFSGIVTDPSAAVTANGVPVSVNPTTGLFTTTLTMSDGLHLIVLLSIDLAGNVGSTSTTVLVDTTAPVVTVTSLPNGLETNQSTVLVSGMVDDPTATVLVNGQQVRPSSSGSWSVTVALVQGDNAITVSAADAAGNRAADVTRTVRYNSLIPKITNDLQGNAQDVTNLRGNVTLKIAIVVIILVALQLVLYWNLNRKIGRLPPKPPEGEAK